MERLKQFILSRPWAVAVSVASAAGMLGLILSLLFLASAPGGIEALGVTNFDVLQVGDGAVGEPSFGFTDDTDTGVYRVGANDIGVVVGGIKVGDFTSAGWTGSIGSSGSLSGAYVTATTASSLAAASATSLAATAGVQGAYVTATTGGALGIATGTSFVGTGQVQGAYVTGTTSISGATVFMGATSFSGPVRFGSATSVVSGTTIAHGLGTTPTAVFLMPGSTGAFTGTLLVYGTDATSITVGIAESAVMPTTVYWLAGR